MMRGKRRKGDSREEKEEETEERCGRARGTD